VSLFFYLSSRAAGRTSAPHSSVAFAYAVDEWLRTSEVEESTRAGYVNYIERYIRPVLGAIAVASSTRTLWSASTPSCAAAGCTAINKAAALLSRGDACEAHRYIERGWRIAKRSPSHNCDGVVLRYERE